MNINQLFIAKSEDRAVSPVIGVILMVAITVILAAVIGTFVLGLGGQVQTTAPNAQFEFDYDSGVGTNGELQITHSGGNGIEANELYLSGDVVETDSSWAAQGVGSSTVKAGDSVTVADSSAEYTWSSPAEEVKVVWRDADSESSSTLRTWRKN